MNGAKASLRSSLELDKEAARPRPKKDGRHINYYIDRMIYERLEEYADEKGQTMTMALERILKQFFDKNDEEKKQSDG